MIVEVLVSSRKRDNALHVSRDARQFSVQDSTLHVIRDARQLSVQRQRSACDPGCSSALGAETVLCM